MMQISHTKEELLEQIEVKDHFFDGNGEKIHYSWDEMIRLIRAKYLYFSAKNEFDFSALDEDTLKNIRETLTFIKAKIFEERKTIPTAVPPERPTLSSRPLSRQVSKEELLEQIEIHDHFVDEDGRIVYYSYDEMRQLCSAKYSRFGHLNSNLFDFSILDETTLAFIAEDISRAEKKILSSRKE